METPIDELGPFRRFVKVTLLWFSVEARQQGTPHLLDLHTQPCSLVSVNVSISYQ